MSAHLNTIKPSAPTLTISNVVDADWLYEHYQDNNVVLLDSTSIESVFGTISKYQHSVIPQSYYIDVEKVFSDTQSPYPHMLISAERFQQHCRALGINDNTAVIIYDAYGIFSSPRIWWMFVVMGHNNVAVLDGGLPAWIDKGYPTISAHKQSTFIGNFSAQLQPQRVKTYEAIVANVDNPTFVIADARAQGRFDGIDPEPRPWLQSGHIPHSYCLPFTEVTDKGYFKSPEALNRLFIEIRAANQPVVFSCGSGITAAIIYLASQLIGIDDVALYDGAWTEWATRQALFTDQPNNVV